MKAVILPIGEVSDVFGFQYWSIPKIDPESNGGPEFPEKLIPEKSYEFDELNCVGMLLSLPHAYKGDAEFRNSVIGEFGLRGCAL